MSDLHSRCAKPLTTYVAKLTLGDVRLAEDIVQETFLRAWQYLVAHEDLDVGSFAPWLYTVARRLVIDVLRMRRARPAEVLVDDLHRAVVTDGDIDSMLTTQAVRAALLRLSPEHRVVLVELYYRGRMVAEVAEEFGVAVGTIKSRSYYAKLALRSHLGL
ncbi:sigma-70 family RNA polymerase sigma factor [Dactylosporangium sp. NPDC048998]|uniref:sigma-70 family RNA polymerase sigma factor n=1 Tax=Dactylosporangium sp. NPDC048998 TaxID=3363976 RepID=UPI003723C9FF